MHSPVQGQLVSPVKGCTAVFTRVGSFSIGCHVQEAMLSKVRGLGEALVANLALVRALSCVRHMMPGQVGLGDKGLATFRALERPFTCVGPQVVPHVHQLLELFATCGALVLALQNMHYPLVPHHPNVGGERLSTLRAKEPCTRHFCSYPGQRGRGGDAIHCCLSIGRHWFWRLARGLVHGPTSGWNPTLASMCTTVVQELGHVAEGFATVTAVQGVGSMALAVHDQSHLCGEADPTVHTEVERLTLVDAHVLLKRCCLFENFVAVGTFISAIYVHSLVSQQPLGCREATLALSTLELFTVFHVSLPVPLQQFHSIKSLFAFTTAEGLSRRKSCCWVFFGAWEWRHVRTASFLRCHLG